MGGLPDAVDRDFSNVWFHVDRLQLWLLSGSSSDENSATAAGAVAEKQFGTFRTAKQVAWSGSRMPDSPMDRL